MNILPQVVLISSLLSLLNSPLLLAEDDAYMDALSSEAGKTSMKEVKEKSESTEKSKPKEEKTEIEAQSPESSDPSKLTETVSQQLEKLLVGREDGDLKQEDLANIVSGAVQKGHEIDSIHDAVTSAMTELRDKEGIDIKAQVLEFSIKSVNEIVGASKDIATGDVEDPYIQSLKAEAESADKEVSNSASDSTATASSSETSSTDKKDKESATKAVKEDNFSKETENKTRTIIVLKGESLSKIAEKIYGSSRKFNLLYEANKDTLKDPNNIHIGQILKIPILPKEE